MGSYPLNPQPLYLRGNPEDSKAARESSLNTGGAKLSTRPYAATFSPSNVLAKTLRAAAFIMVDLLLASRE